MRRSASIGLAILGLAAPGPAAAADAADPWCGTAPGRFLATCEDLGGLCFAQACGRDQIEAAQGCRAACPSAVVMTVEPAACPVPVARPAILRSRG